MTKILSSGNSRSLEIPISLELPRCLGKELLPPSHLHAGPLPCWSRSLHLHGLLGSRLLTTGPLCPESPNPTWGSTVSRLQWVQAALPFLASSGSRQVEGTGSNHYFSFTLQLPLPDSFPLLVCFCSLSDSSRILYALSPLRSHAFETRKLKLLKVKSFYSFFTPPLPAVSKVCLDF